MPRKDRPQLSKEEIAKAFGGESGTQCRAIISPAELAEILGVSVKTVYFWIAAGRLDGTFRKRGKHNLILKDRAIAQIFNGPEWTTNDE